VLSFVAPSSKQELKQSCGVNAMAMAISFATVSLTEVGATGHLVLSFMHFMCPVTKFCSCIHLLPAKMKSGFVWTTLYDISIIIQDVL